MNTILFNIYLYLNVKSKEHEKSERMYNNKKINKQKWKMISNKIKNKTKNRRQIKSNLLIVTTINQYHHCTLTTNYSAHLNKNDL